MTLCQAVGFVAFGIRIGTVSVGKCNLGRNVSGIKCLICAASKNGAELMKAEARNGVRRFCPKMVVRPGRTTYRVTRLAKPRGFAGLTGSAPPCLSSTCEYDDDDDDDAVFIGARADS